MFVGFSGTGEMQTEPAPDSANSAGLSRIPADRIAALILNLVLPIRPYALLVLPRKKPYDSQSCCCDCPDGNTFKEHAM
jgi:hypothetical protein